jgi:hypothetical protein
MVNIQIVLYVECSLEVGMISSARILHQCTKRDTIRLRVTLYTFVPNDGYGRREKHDEELKVVDDDCNVLRSQSLESHLPSPQ